jgi:hypothetical protein
MRRVAGGLTMHSPTLALSWQIWRRHRYGLAAVLLYLVAAAVVFHLLPAGTREDGYGALLSIQVVVGLVYVPAVFTYGFDCRLEARESGFPARLFTLPIRTSVLVGWPMLQGMGAAALLWLAWARFVLWPAGLEVALGSTALLAAAFVAVLQALLWSSFGLPWVRVVLTVVLLPLLAVSPLLGSALEIRESVLLGLYVALIAFGAATAFVGVRRARRGAVPDWRGPFRAPRGVGRGSAGHLAPFSSPGRAQFWYERRRHLLGFPLIAGVCLALHLALVVWMETQGVKPGVKEGVVFVLMPVLVAPLFGSALARTGTAGGNSFHLSSFTATRPLSDAALIAAKLRVAALATLATWAVALLAIATWLVQSENARKLSESLGEQLRAYPPGRLAAIVLLIVGGLLLMTWRLLVDNLWLGLAGRAWLVRGSLAACGAGLCLALALWEYVGDTPGLREQLRDALPWYAAGAALVKLLAAAGVGRALLRRGLVRPQALAKWLGVWLLAAATLFGLAWAAVEPDAVPVSLLASGAVLGVPLVRLAAAPLSLAWNRHR